MEKCGAEAALGLLEIPGLILTWVGFACYANVPYQLVGICWMVGFVGPGPGPWTIPPVFEAAIVFNSRPLADSGFCMLGDQEKIVEVSHLYRIGKAGEPGLEMRKRISAWVSQIQEPL